MSLSTSHPQTVKSKDVQNTELPVETLSQTATPQTSKNWKTAEFKSCTRMQLAYDRCNELTQYPSLIGGLPR